MLWLHDRSAAVSEEPPSNVVQGMTGDPDDDYIASVAYLGGAEIIVSGDPHLTDLGTVRRGDGGVIARVLSPRTFLDELDRGV